MKDTYKKIEAILIGWKNLIIRNPKVEAHAIKRLEVCIDCSNNSTPNKIDMSSQCSLCTCWLEAKSRNLEQSCPIDKWQLIDKEMEL